jgi:hypothetical protein
VKPLGAGSTGRFVAGVHGALLVAVRSAPPSLWLLFPEPDDPIHILWLTTEVFEPGHALAAMVLRVHRKLHHRLGDRDDARRVWKPRNTDVV